MNKYLLVVVIGLLCFSFKPKAADQDELKLGLLKYKGGGDWYANPTALPNLAKFCNKNLGTNFSDEPETVEVGSPELFNFPFVHMTGHGNVVLNNDDAENLRNYLLAGGFLHVDDNYGMDKFVRPMFKQLFPEQELIELPFAHEVYQQPYEFKNGLPKIHKHDEAPAQGLGIIIEGRLVVFYSFESDLGDGWEDIAVHKDPESVRQKALKMGANIVQYAFTQ